MPAESESQVPRASVGVLVTLPPEWWDLLRLEVRCPKTCGWTWSFQGAGSFNDLTIAINKHVCGVR